MELCVLAFFIFIFQKNEKECPTRSHDKYDLLKIRPTANSIFFSERGASTLSAGVRAPPGTQAGN
jgi:hypothetical protein